MLSHLSFLEDAVEQFLEAFELHQRLVSAEPEKRDLRTAARCVRELYLALEKGCKHALALIDPYMLISKPERALLLQLRKDVLARPVPSIFCSRQRLETLSMAQTWQTLREIKSPCASAAVVAEFERSLNRLADVRNRAQHGELYEEVDEVLATVEQVLARFSAVISELSPEWLERMHAKNGQLRSRLRGIENQVDASWQVVVDYIRSHGPFELALTLWAVNELGRESVHVLFGSYNEHVSNMLGASDVPPSMVTGLFRSFLTKQQADDRYTARRSPAVAKRSAAVDVAAVFGSGKVPSTDKPLLPLEPGSMSVPTASVWLSLYLPRITPQHVFLSATLSGFRLEFASETELAGTVVGALECAVAKGTIKADTVEIEGTAYLQSELNLPADTTASPPKPERTQRGFELLLQLTAAA